MSGILIQSQNWVCSHKGRHLLHLMTRWKSHTAFCVSMWPPTRRVGLAGGCLWNWNWFHFALRELSTAKFAHQQKPGGKGLERHPPHTHTCGYGHTCLHKYHQEQKLIQTSRLFFFPPPVNMAFITNCCSSPQSQPLPPLLGLCSSGLQDLFDLMED